MGEFFWPIDSCICNFPFASVSSESEFLENLDITKSAALLRKTVRRCTVSRDSQHDLSLVLCRLDARSRLGAIYHPFPRSGSLKLEAQVRTFGVAGYGQWARALRPSSAARFNSRS